MGEKLQQGDRLPTITLNLIDGNILELPGGHVLAVFGSDVLPWSVVTLLLAAVSRLGIAKGCAGRDGAHNDRRQRRTEGSRSGDG